MEIIPIVLLGISGAVVAILLRTAKRPEMAMLAALAAGLAVLYFVLSKLSGMVYALWTMADKGRVDGEVFAVVLKVIAIAYIAEFGAQVCHDAGEAGLAKKVELGGKVTVLALSVPILSALLDLILALVP